MARSLYEVYEALYEVYDAYRHVYKKTCMLVNWENFIDERKKIQAAILQV